MKARITTTYEVDGKSALSAQEIVGGSGEYTKDFEVPGGETLTFPLALDVALTESIVIIPTADMTFVIGNQTFTRDAGHPLIWTKGSQLPRPIAADTQEITILNHGETNTLGTLHVRIIEQAQPPNADQPPALAIAAGT